jgi:hypothetical protein
MDSIGGNSEHQDQYEQSLEDRKSLIAPCWQLVDREYPAQDFLKSFTDLVSASVKYLIPATKDYHVTRVVDAVMELKSSPDIDNYLYLDPKFQPDAAPRKTTPFRQAIVFVLGGGNYLEYLNLMDYAKRVCSWMYTILRDAY